MRTDHFDKVLFVCVGNICRSPMAAALLGNQGFGRSSAEVESAGMAAPEGNPADPLAIALMRERGIDISGHRARQLTPELAAAFDLILVMEKRQERAVEQIFPPARGRVHRIGRFGNFDVPDPYGKPRAAFEHSLALIERGIQDFLRAFWGVK